MAATIQLANLGGAGVRILGGAAGNYAGSSVAGGTGLPTALTVDSLGSNGLVLQGPVVSDTRSVLAAGGDIDSDGIPDVLVGAPRDEGEMFVIYGNAGLGANLTLASGPGFSGRVNSYVTGNGNGLAGGGDVNGDGIDDIIIGGPAYGYGFGIATVVFGSASRFGVDTAVDPLGVPGFRITNSANQGDQLGDRAAILGDVNGDGIDDLLLGATGNDVAGDNAGAAYIVFGFSTAAQNLAGGSDADTLTSGVGDDTLSGGGGHDLLVAGGGNDMIDGGDDSLFGNLGDASQLTAADFFFS